MSADAERDRVVAWLRDAADQWRAKARDAATVGVASMRVAKAMAIEEAADELSRNAHRRSPAFEGDTPP